MTKVTEPKYRLEVNDGKIEFMRAWEGKATEKRLGKYISAYIESLKVNGSNAHLSKALGYMPIPSEARIVNQKTSVVAAVWKAPQFMAF